MYAQKSDKPPQIIAPWMLLFGEREVPKKYHVHKLVGKGSYGAVAVASVLGSEEKVAIKRIDNLFVDRGDDKRILREICLLRRLNHPNLVKIREIIKPVNLQSFKTLFVVTELCGKSLLKKTMEVGKFGTKDVKWVCYQILLGLNYLHQCSVLHRDLKPANILIQRDLTTKICDFGLARSFHNVMPPLYASDPKRLKIEEDEAKMEEEAELGIFNQKQAQLKIIKLQSANEEPINESKQPPKKEKPKLTKTKTKAYSKEQMNQAPSEKKEAFSPTGSTEDKLKSMRKISYNVVSRWYRSPEVILMQPYTCSIDLWSFGCIFAQFLMTPNNNNTNNVLFAGKSCFPKSPTKRDEIIEKGSQKYYIISYDDQLNKIFDIIGTPEEEELDWIEQENVKEYVRSFTKRQGTGFKEMMAKDTDPEAIDLLERLIVFDPRKRIKIQEIFQHPFFKEVRNKQSQRVEARPIEMDFEEEDLTFGRLRQLFVQEILEYHPDA